MEKLELRTVVAHITWISLLLLLSCVLLKALHNCYLHPCARFTGPLEASLSRLPLSYHTIRGTRIFWVKSLHDKYGSVVRVAPDELSFTSPGAWKDIYGDRSKGKSKGFPKDSLFYSAFQGINGPSLLTAADDDHSRMRTLLSRFFSERSLKEQERLFIKFGDNLVQNLEKHCQSGTQANMQSIFNFLGFDVISALSFGESFDMLSKNAMHPWVERIFSSVKAMSLKSVLGYYPALDSTLTALLPKSIKQLEQDHFGFINLLVDKRLNSTHAPKDIWTYAQQRGEEDRGLTRDEVCANAALFAVAGSETTAAAMVGTTYNLLRHPSSIQALTREIRHAFPANADINLSTLSTLPYLNACLQEGIRCYPPSPTGLPRRTPPGGGSVAGERIPENTVVYVSHYAAYHSADNFTNPDSFRPERWLNDESFRHDKREVLQPFNYGPRNCIGQSMAWHEMRLALAKILWHFDLRLASESQNWIDHKCFVLWEKPPLYVSVRKRSLRGNDM